MSFTVHCPTCDARLKVADDAAGKTVRCPKCAADMVIPAGTPSPPPIPGRSWAPPEPVEYEDDEPPQPSRRRKPKRFDDDEDDYDDDRPVRRGGRASPTSRTVYIVLGLFLGGLGIHNFVAGRTGIAIAQLVIFLVSFPLMCLYVGFITIWIPGIWALVDIIIVQHDGKGRRMP